MLKLMKVYFMLNPVILLPSPTVYPAYGISKNKLESIIISNNTDLEGLVLKSTGSWYTVLTDNRDQFQCSLKGNFRIKGIRNTNPVAVGDKVILIVDKEKSSAVISEILPRKNYIIRKATKLSKRSHIIASNIDQALLIITLALPRTSFGFIDRFLITAEAYHIPVTIIINKIDIYLKPTLELLKEYINVYEGAGYEVLTVSAKSGENIAALKSVMKDKVSLFAGHSGVGKSTLINEIQPGMNIKTMPLSEVHLKGLHTTTFAEMHPLDFGGFIIDTPGIKEFGLIDFNPSEIAERYPEMRAIMHKCKYHNCTHIHEPGCAVKEAVDNGRISEIRYYNYLRIVENEENENDLE